MANTSKSSTFFVPSPYDQQMAEIQRRQKMAELMQQQGLEPLESMTAPGGMVVPTSPLLGLAKMLQVGLGSRALNAVEKQRGAAEEKGRTEATDWLDSLQRGKQSFVGQPLTPDQTMEAALAPGGAPTQPTGQMVSQPYSAQERATQIQKAAFSGNPNMRLAAQLAASQKAPTAPIKDIDVDKFTPESIGAFQFDFARSGAPNYSLLKPIAEKPAKTNIERKTRTSYDSAGNEIHQDYNFNPATGEETVVGKTYRGKPNSLETQKMPASMISANISDQSEITRLGDNKKQLGGFIEDIENGNLPLSRGANLKYEAQQAASGLNVGGIGFGEASPEAVRYFELKRAIGEQVNAILNLAKGPQTDQDARRAQNQILANLNDPKIVASGLRRLQEIFDRESEIRQESISERNKAYGRTSVPAPPPGFERPGGKK